MELCMRFGSSQGLTFLSGWHPWQIAFSAVQLQTVPRGANEPTDFQECSWILSKFILLVLEILTKASNLGKVIPADLRDSLKSQFLKQQTEGLSSCCLYISLRRWGNLPILQPSVNLTELFSWTNWVNYFLNTCCCGLSLSLLVQSLPGFFSSFL